MISTFDFAHAFVFKARLVNNEMKGVFYSGNHWSAPFRAVVNPNAELGNPKELVEVIDSLGYNFVLRGLSGEQISIEHALFENKAVVIQIFGSWCPNCYDESIFLNNIYSDFPKNKIEFIGVAFERSSNFELAKEKIEKFRSGLSIKYPLAYGGTSNKDSAQMVFPFLKEVLSFPTLLFYNKDHELVGIHTGFSGPGTGDEYLKTRNEIVRAIEDLIRE
jgi:thiol-disulfide isomerase/thioredoxin